jgi:GTPase
MNRPNTSPNVAIVGRPNVGKSALFNRLVGRRIAIVHDQPGITRDRISAICTRGAQPFMLWDTGGVAGAGESELTALVRRAVERAIQDSDVLLFIVDAKDGLSPADQELARILRKSRKPVVLVINKIDNENQENLSADFASLGFSRSQSVSAEHNRGVSELVETIDQLLPFPSAVNQSPVTSRKSLSIAIIGRPNVGKSSLINAIVRNERAIVSELPGTTRDAIDILYRRDGHEFLFIDTAGIRRRAKHSTSAEVFSVMRAERSIQRAHLCILIVDLTMGATAQDKRIAGMIQQARKAAIIVLNKWDLIKPRHAQKKMISDMIDETRARIFFLDYAPVLVASAQTGENINKLFALIGTVRLAAQQRIGTGVLNRLFRSAFAANPPPMVSGRRLKLFYAAQASGKPEATLEPPEFAIFVNEPRLLTDTYRRYLEARIRKAQPFPGLPIVLTLRPRAKSVIPVSRSRRE